MATATKKAPAKKAGAAKKTTAKKPAAKKGTETSTSAAERSERNAKLTEVIVERRSGDSPDRWEDIAKDLGIATGKAMLLHMYSQVRPKDRIKADSDEELGKKIAHARDVDLLSWGQIMARTGLSEGRCRKLYTEATGNDTKGHRIGKGGRYPDGVTPPARASSTGEKMKKGAAAKKAAAKKAPAGKQTVGQRLAELDDDGVAEELEGSTVSVKAGRKTLKYNVVEVEDFEGEGEDRKVTVALDNGENAQFSVVNITKVA